MKNCILLITVLALAGTLAALGQSTPLTAAEHALATTILFKPLRNDTRLTLPPAPAGYRWSIEKTAPAGIVAADGTLTRPANDTLVAVSLAITSATRATDVARVTLTVPIDRPYVAPTVSAEQIKASRTRYGRQKYGVFVHYVPGLTVDASSQKPSIDELAARFDATQFAQDMADFGAEYVIFTAWHLNARPLYPSAVSKRWRDDRRASGGTDPKSVKTYSEADLIDRLATALEAKKIDLHLYVHPNDGHDFSAEDARLTGWEDRAAGYPAWNAYQNEVFDELGRRYGSRIKGYWFDALFSNRTEQKRLRETIDAYSPGIALVGNVANNRKRTLFPEWTVADYRSWECGGAAGNYSLEGVNPHIRQDDTRTWPGTHHQVSMIVGANWWAVNPKAKAKSDPENLYRYLVLQASISTGGGVAIAAGCFPDSAALNANGTLWEGNFREVMVGLNQLVTPVAASIKDTLPGQAFVTPERQRLNQQDWGVSTESPDGKTVYLHILKPPAGQTLKLGLTEDGSTLIGPAVNLKTGQTATLTSKRMGYELTLPEGEIWDALDTVIKVQRQ